MLGLRNSDLFSLLPLGMHPSKYCHTLSGAPIPASMKRHTAPTDRDCWQYIRGMHEETLAKLCPPTNYRGAPGSPRSKRLSSFPGVGKTYTSSFNRDYITPT